MWASQTDLEQVNFMTFSFIIPMEKNKNIQIFVHIRDNVYRIPISFPRAQKSIKVVTFLFNRTIASQFDKGTIKIT